MATVDHQKKAQSVDGRSRPSNRLGAEVSLSSTPSNPNPHSTVEKSCTCTLKPDHSSLLENPETQEEPGDNTSGGLLVISIRSYYY
ncbi:hypothetical protein PCANC_05131 [Puccinia coronata f. sp. avenae]|uniref:Uncharacterized protein n=1 Tax=Puccinia coronata f. sp. avenae TaxID=200324 RepID=A0A2N5W353_9BASI|nr:hypothetical protein PCANC_05131 [Puccinia coronata f. sp. avenae]